MIVEDVGQNPPYKLFPRDTHTISTIDQHFNFVVADLISDGVDLNKLYRLKWSDQTFVEITGNYQFNELNSMKSKDSGVFIGTCAPQDNTGFHPTCSSYLLLVSPANTATEIYPSITVSQVYSTV